MSTRTSVETCVQQLGSVSRCSQIAGRLEQTHAQVLRAARLANMSARAFARHADELAAAKRDRRAVFDQRDQHVAECPAAAVRFTT